jgi:hypothetical protein
MPPVDALVIIECLQWNTAYSYVSGMWSDDYETGKYRENQLVLTDGEGINIIIDAGEKKITIDSGEGSIVTLEEKKIKATNGELELVLNGDKAAVKNSSKSFFTILDRHFEYLIAMKTMVAPHSML